MTITIARFFQCLTVSGACMEGFVGLACDRLHCVDECHGRGACLNTVREVFMIHVGGTRCVTSSTGNIRTIHARITLTVACIRRACICICLLHVGIQGRVGSRLTFFIDVTAFHRRPAWTTHNIAVPPTCANALTISLAPVVNCNIAPWTPLFPPPHGT